MVTIQTFFLIFTGMLHAAVAIYLAKSVDRVAFSRTVAILFAFNTVAISGIVVQSIPGWTVVGRNITVIVDAPTASIILVLLYGLVKDDPPSRLPVWALGVGLLHLIIAGAQVFAEWPAWSEKAVAGVPIMIAYTGILSILPERIRKGELEELAFVVPLLLAFAFRASEFGWLYGFTWGLYRLAQEGSGSFHIETPFRILLFWSMVITMARLGWSAATGFDQVRRNWHRVSALAMVGGGVLAGSFLLAQPGFPAFILSTFSLIILRPILVAYAFGGSEGFRMTGLVAIGFGAYLLLRTLLAGVTNQPLNVLGAADVAAVALMAVIAATVVASTTLGDRRGQCDTGPKPATKAEMLIMLLVDEGSANGMPSNQIQDGLGIGRNNLAQEVRRARAKLAAWATNTDTELIEGRVRGIRGRKYYRLTPAGRSAAQAMRQERPAVPRDQSRA